MQIIQQAIAECSQLIDVWLQLTITSCYWPSAPTFYCIQSLNRLHKWHISIHHNEETFSWAFYIFFKIFVFFVLSNKCFHLFRYVFHLFPINIRGDTENHWPVLHLKMVENSIWYFFWRINAVVRPRSSAKRNSASSAELLLSSQMHVASSSAVLSLSFITSHRALIEDEAFVKSEKTGAICTSAFQPQQTMANGSWEP